ncbi:MAG: hypothetical protein HeimC3_16070 [Candidatus Heimdallarchaeota archaeon LC_3]|nr:MAG: hypothetical protein HeimC3_16070 [Candidatus Heimdallarchaeota archaeon LC_3]
MKIVYQSLKLDTLCNNCNIPLNRNIDPSILLTYITSVKEQLVKKITQLQMENEKLFATLRQEFSKYRPQIINQEHMIRDKHKDLYVKNVGEKKLSLSSQLQIRKYQNELEKIIQDYEKTYIPVNIQFNNNKSKIDQDNTLLHDMNHFIEFIALIEKLLEFEGSCLLFDWFLIIISTSGLHIVYNTLPEGMTEDSYRNTLYDNIMNFFTTYFGKKTDVIIDLFNIAQYNQIDYEHLPDRLDFEDLTLFTNIMEKNSLELTI